MENFQSILSLESRRKKLEQRVQNLGPVLRGSVVELSRPCTYPRCRKCQDGTKHPSIYHSITKHSKTQLTYIPKAVQAEALQWNQNWKRTLRIVDELTHLNLQILKAKAKQLRQQRSPETVEARQ